MSPTVINRHHYRGRSLPAPFVYVGRDTPLGNTVSTKQRDGNRALGIYRDWLWHKILLRDSVVMRALNSITPAHRLVCSCAPAPCHADIILELWEWLAGKGEW